MSTIERVTAPGWPVAGALVVTVASIGIAAASVMLVGFASLPLVTAGYVLGAIATTVLVSIYRATRNSRRNHPRFRVQRGRDRVAGVTMCIGIVAGLANAVLLATELAKL